MRPCSKTRKQIALLAMAGSDIRGDPVLWAHLETCTRCRAYLSEISGVVEALGALEPSSDIRASDVFHRKTLAALKACEKSSAGESLRVQVRSVLQSLLNWRIAAPAALIVTLFIATRRPPHVVAVPPLLVRAQPARDFPSDPDPTVANYEIAASQSLEKLDEMITREGRKDSALAPLAPLYTAAAFSRWIGPD